MHCVTDKDQGYLYVTRRWLAFLRGYWKRTFLCAPSPPSRTAILVRSLEVFLLLSLFSSFSFHAGQFMTYKHMNSFRRSSQQQASISLAPKKRTRTERKTSACRPRSPHRKYLLPLFSCLTINQISFLSPTHSQILRTENSASTLNFLHSRTLDLFILSPSFGEAIFRLVSMLNRNSL